MLGRINRTLGGVLIRFGQRLAQVCMWIDNKIVQGLLWAGARRQKILDLFVLYARLAFLLLLVSLLVLFAGYLAWHASDSGRWAIALLFSIGVGQVACRFFLWALRKKYIGIERDRSRGVPPSLLGGVEQLVFVIAVGFFYEDLQALAGVFAVMGLWLGAKMLTGWNRAGPTIVWSQHWQEHVQRKQQQDIQARGALTALLAGVLSLAIATVHGSIAARGPIASLGYAVYTGDVELIFGAGDGANPTRYYPAIDIAL